MIELNLAMIEKYAIMQLKVGVIMAVFEILKRLMIEKEMSIPEVARQCGLSDGTVRNIISRSQSDIALNVAAKLAKGLDVSIYFLNGEKEPREIKTPATDNGGELDNDEQTLIDTYRDMTPKGQKVLLETAETLHGNFKKDDTVQNGKSVG